MPTFCIAYYESYLSRMDTVHNVAGFVRGGASLDTSGTSCVTGSSVKRVPGTVITLKQAQVLILPVRVASQAAALSGFRVQS
jgi:hypothetical protein